MDASRAIVSSGAGTDSEDVLKVLGRVADAFDNPGPLHKAGEDVLFVVNVVKSRHLLPSLSSEESVCQDGAGKSYASSLDSSSDEDVEVVELGDASRWGHARSYPSRRGFSEKIFRQDDGMYDITRMLLASSPLDRLDRLARMELKKTGWFERRDKWSIVALGLQRGPSPPPPDLKRRTSSSDGHCPADDDDDPKGSDSYLADCPSLSFGMGQVRPRRRGRIGRIVDGFVRRVLAREERTRWSGFWQ